MRRRLLVVVMACVPLACGEEPLSAVPDIDVQGAMIDGSEDVPQAGDSVNVAVEASAAASVPVKASEEGADAVVMSGTDRKSVV